MFDKRIFRVYRKPKDLPQVAEQLEDLRAMLFSVIQDAAVMREMLERKGLWDEAQYKELRMLRMLHDHSSAGASPWCSYSQYPHTLDEVEFLRETLGASDAEIEEYKKDVEFAHTQT